MFNHFSLRLLFCAKQSYDVSGANEAQPLAQSDSEIPDRASSPNVLTQALPAHSQGEI